MQNSKEVIDLTSLDYYIPSNNRRFFTSNEVINLVDDSFEEENIKPTDKIKTKKSGVKDDPKKKNSTSNEENSMTIGLCSICWDRLGNNQLASTKCGHVYCLDCIERSLKCDKRCPTCRCVLKGVSAYHPLYLELG